jgi:hypothetical protein
MTCKNTNWSNDLRVYTLVQGLLKSNLLLIHYENVWILVHEVMVKILTFGLVMKCWDAIVAFPVVCYK